mgnify:CR=1 FL=1
MPFLRFLSAGVLAAATALGAQTEPDNLSASEPAGELTLQQAISLSAGRNPEIAALASEVRAREGRVLQARALPNPEISGTTENLGGDIAKTGGVQSTFQLGQRLELGGDRAARTGAARAALDLGRSDLESRRLEIVARTTRAFIDVLSAQRRLELSTGAVRLAEELKITVAARVEAGKVSPIEETRAEVSLASERIERERAAADLAAARSRLAATWGSTSPRFERAAGDLDMVPILPSLESVAGMIERHPEVGRWTAEIAEREALLRIEQARAVPDVTVGGGYRHFEVGEGAFVATVTLPLPLFDRNRGGKIEAGERIARAREERRAAIVRLRQSADEARSFLARSRAEVRSLREQVIPAAESVYEAVSEGYRLGKFGYMEVLDARRTLAAVRLQLVRAQTELQHAFADLQRITAAPMNDLTNGEQQK